MAGRWGGDIKGRRKHRVRRRDWWTPKVPRVKPTPETAALVAATGFYCLTIAGALLTVLG